MTTLYKWIYELSYRFTQPNWDQDTVPPEVVTLAQKGGARGRALDLGCGTGTHSIYLAQQGYSVVGVDFSSQAIEMARGKARRDGVNVDFQIGDVTRLDSLHDPFDISLDVGCFHGLNKTERTRYAETLARLMRSGGLFLLWAVEEQSHMGIGIAPEEIRQSFSAHFVLDHTQRDNLHGRASAWYWFSRR
jgi:2-polyprenyl-3-methyl-5-hydroxy-6-metoxy-1,4-benzoquinol methylase